MTSDKVKTVLLLGGGLAVLLFSAKVYAVAKSTGSTVRDALDSVVTAGDAAIESAQAAIAEKAADFKASIVSTGDSLAGFSNYLTGNAPAVSPAFAVKVSPSKWDASTINLVQAMNLAHNRQAKDYSDWQVFSDGTIITPAGEYLQMDYASPAMEKADDWAFRAVWSPIKSNKTMFDMSYPEQTDWNQFL